MDIKQWENKNLAHFSYSVLSNCEKKMVLIDPSRNPAPYLAYAKEHEAEIVAVIETHPHADFVSSHKEIQKLTGAVVYISKLVDAQYAHHSFDDGDTLQLGKIKLSAMNTPGHSVDSISILLEHDGKQHAVFTGDTLFIGDCGRPDLRESAGNIKMSRKDQAKQMYFSLREKLMTLEDDVLVYPAHGAGTLCGKSLSEAHSSTIGEEKKTNWSLQDMTEEEFVADLLSDQPFIPAYFPFDVELNRNGLPDFRSSVLSVSGDAEMSNVEFSQSAWVVDVRPQNEFKKGYLSHSLNLMEGGKFETWLGTLIQPGEKFYMMAEDKEQVNRVIERAADIGYESNILAAYVFRGGTEYFLPFEIAAFSADPGKYTIVDVRNPSEVATNRIFSNAINIPLPELIQRAGEIPAGKPVVVHCAGGYRSAAAASIIKDAMKGKQLVYDMSDSIKRFEKQTEPVH